MSEPLRLRVLDSTFELDAAEPAAGAELLRLWGGFAVDAAGPARALRLDSADQVPALSAEINRTALEEFGGFAAHAGVLTRGEVTVAVAGRSGQGKSTLVAAALRAGFDYVSDEALCVRWPSAELPGLPDLPGTDEVTAYPRPIGLTPWSVERLGLTASHLPTVLTPPEAYLTAADLGAVVRAEPPPLRHVVLLDNPTAETDLRPARRSEVAAALLSLSFTAWRRPEAAFALAHRLAGAAQAWRLRPGPPAEAAARLAALVDQADLSDLSDPAIPD